MDKSLSRQRKRFDYKSYPLIHDQALYVLSLSSQKVLYSKNIQRLLGYSEKEFDYNAVYKLIHPDDYPLVRHIVRSTLLFSSRYGINKDSVLFLTYRIRKKDGSYIRVQRTSGICRLTKNRNLERNYSIIQDISYMTLDNKVRWKWNSPTVSDEIYRKFVEFTPDQFFTKGQQRVFDLMRRGLMEKDIAEKLDVKLSTVTTQRKKMLKRLNCSTTKELIEYFEKNHPDIPKPKPVDRNEDKEADQSDGKANSDKSKSSGD